MKLEGQTEQNLGRVKGEPFTYEDFTPAQLAQLQGPEGDRGPKGEQGEQGDQGPKGDPFTYEDLTEEQKVEITNAGIDLSEYAKQEDLEGFVSQDNLIEGLASLDSKIEGKADEDHKHEIADVTGLQGQLNGKASKADLENIDLSDYAKQEDLNGKADKDHTHSIGDVTGLQPDLNKLIEIMKVDEDGNLQYRRLNADKEDWKSALASNKVALKDHTHSIADVTGLQGQLDGKASKADLENINSGASASELARIEEKVDNKATKARANENGDIQYYNSKDYQWQTDDTSQPVALKSDLANLDLDVDLSDYAKKSELNTKADKTETAQKVNYVKVGSDGHVKYIKDQADFRPDGPWKNVADSKPVALKDHKHGISDINGLQSELDSLSQAGGLDEVTRKKIDDSLTTFRVNGNGKPQYSRDNGDTWTHYSGTEDVALKNHTHAISDITGLQGEINNLREGLRTRAEDIGRLETQVGRIRDNKSDRWLDVEIVNSGQVPANTSGKIVFERE